MRRRYYPFFLATFLFNICVFGQEAVGKSNVLLIVIDDLGWRDLGCYGSTFHETPNIDALAKEGILFTNAYATSPVCSPSRSSILTGKYTTQTGVTDFIGAGSIKDTNVWFYKLIPPTFEVQLNKEHTNISQILKLNNFENYYIGKWHLGDKDFYPKKQGFDRSIAASLTGRTRSYFPPYELPNFKGKKKQNQFLTESLTEKAKTVISKHLKRKTDQPFFLALNYYAVHTPIQATKDKIEKYTTKVKKQQVKGKVWGKLKGNNVRLKQNSPSYAAMVEMVDESLGDLLQFLRELNIDNNTLIIITSDNGGLSTQQSKKIPACNLPLKGGKGCLYEGGIRVPFIVKRPNSKSANIVTNNIICHIDILPTVLGELKSNTYNYVGDGVNLFDYDKERCVFWHYPHYGGGGVALPASAVRCGDYKLLYFYETKKYELYNLEEDIGEHFNLVKSKKKKFAELKEKLDGWLLKTDAKFPIENTNYDPKKLEDFLKKKHSKKK